MICPHCNKETDKPKSKDDYKVKAISYDVVRDQDGLIASVVARREDNQ
jgi:hypothetical protein